MRSQQSQGGHARAKALSRSERREIASRAARARWRDPKKVIRDRQALATVCRKYGITALYAFGSLLRKDFEKRSDVDLMYVAREPLGLAFFDAVDDLEALFGRKVDFVNKHVIEQSENPHRRDEILSTARLVYSEEAEERA